MTIEQYQAIYNKFTEAQDRGDLHEMRIAFLELYTHAVGMENNLLVFGSIAGSNQMPDPRIGIVRRLELANEYECQRIADLMELVQS